MYVGFFSPLHGAFTLVTYDEPVMAVPLSSASIEQEPHNVRLDTVRGPLGREKKAPPSHVV